MPAQFQDKVRALTPAKALAIAAYGESVASYRYRTLAEKAPTETHRTVFLEMADEEQGHHQIVQDTLRQKFPGSDFVLTPEDKELVIVGPRMIDVSDEDSVNRALEMIYESELRTGQFYAALHDVFPLTELQPFLQEMADECFDHAERLKQLPTSK